MLLITLLLTLLDATLQPPTAERRDVTGDDDDDDDDVMAVSRDVEASDSELAYKFCSLIRLQQLRTADNRHQLAATLCGSRPGVQSASPQTHKNTSF